jgi:hypothetical protein
MASEEIISAPRRDLFQQGRRALRGTTTSPQWPVTIFRVPFGIMALPETRSYECYVSIFLRDYTASQEYHAHTTAVKHNLSACYCHSHHQPVDRDDENVHDNNHRF